uniref:Peptidylglycine alpha-amidating monooxygenase n=1 Tax=Sphaeramia orbicularis TaxID=375764 RepID=A0A673AIN2_9TELE
MLVLAIICHSHGLERQNPLYRSRRSQENVWANPSDCGSRTKPPMFLTNANNFSVDLRMPGVVPSGSDTYLCMAFPVPTSQDAYIVDFIPHASMNTVHHMLLFGCKTPVSKTNYWDCGSVKGTCEDEASIMYAWARNAPPTKLPKDVGFKVGRHSGMSYFVLQIHYGDISAFRENLWRKDLLTMRTRPNIPLTVTLCVFPPQRQPFIAGIYLLMSVDTVILPGKRVTNADIACDYTSYPIYPFAFRTHTHHLGQVVSGYRIRDGRWSLIGRQSPQLPQAFYPANQDVNIKYGDTVAARCVFTGEGRTSKTYIGGTSADEMCNFYIMYYMDSRHSIPYMNCMEPGSKELFQRIPAEANVPIPVSPSQMHSMMHMGQSAARPCLQFPCLFFHSVLSFSVCAGDLYSLLSKLLGQSQDVVPIHKYDPSDMLRAQAELVADINSIMQNKDLGSPSARLAYQTREDPVLVRDRVHKFHQLEAMAKPPRSKLLAEGQGGSNYHLEQVTGWPQSSLQLGQVSGLALDSDSNLVIFHRGDHHWGADSFNLQAKYQQRSLGPIQQSTILVVDPAKGNILKASGRNMFYLPHGITTDKDNNYWVTDVALHQVLKVSSDGRDRTLVSLGEAFTPGSDSNHFCQPTDVAVDTETGNIFVSDGYCNARILKFSADGKYLTEWGAGSSDRRRRVPFQIPHSLVFLPDRREVCVADRENGRIQCFIAETGEFVKEIKKEEFGGEVFAITYSPVGDGLIFAVNGESPYGRSAPLRGFVIDYSTKNIVDTFTFFNPNIFLHVEVEAFVQAKVKPQHNMSKAPAAVQEKQSVVQQPPPPPPPPHEESKEEKKSSAEPNKEQDVFPVVITMLLLIPLLLVVAMGVFICWRKKRKAVGSLNLGNFFASHKGYSRQGFDQLSTEGSDQERNDEESSDSENEEYSALPPPPQRSSS